VRAPLRSRPRYTQKLLQQEFFAHRDFETQALLRTEALTHRQLLHTEAFTHRCFTHRYLHPQTPLHAELLTQMFLRRSLYKQMFFYTQKLYTHPRLCTQKLSHTGAFAQGKLLHTRTLFPQFWTIDAHFVRETSTESKPNPNFPPVFDGQHAFGGAQGVRFMSMGTAGGSKDFIYMRMFSRRSIRLHPYTCIYTPASAHLHLHSCRYMGVFQKI